MATREELLKAAKRKVLLQKAKEKLKRQRAGQEDKLSDWVSELGSTRQEMHPDISMKDRWVVKNLSQSPEKSVEYLKQQYPNLEVELSPNGQLRARKPGEQWMAVDPDTGMISSDLGGDIGDIAYDIYGAASEGAATLGGGLAGSAGGPVGTLAGGMAAGAATTAANEAMRQKLGSWLGIPQEVSGTDVAIAGGIGAAAPIVGGVGKTPGLAERGAKLTGKALKKMDPFPWLASKATGVPTQTIRNFQEGPVQEGVKRLNREGFYDYADETYNMIKGHIKSNKDDAAKNLVDVMENMDSQVDISAAKKAFADAGDEIMSRGDDLTNSDVEKLDKLNTIYRRYFGTQDDGFLPDQVGGAKAWQLQKDLKQTAKYGSDMSPEELYSKGVSRDAYSKLNDAFEQASDGASAQAKARYRDAVKLDDEILGKLTGRNEMSSADKTFKMFSNLDRQANQIFGERLRRIAPNQQIPDDQAARGVWQRVAKMVKPKEKPPVDPIVSEIGERAKVLNAYKYFGEKPGETFFDVVQQGNRLPLATAGGLMGAYTGSHGGFTGQPGADAGIGAAIGAGLGNTIASRQALKRYIQAMSAAGRFRNLMTPRGTPVTRAIGTGIVAEGLNE
jgi:hypothetical protein